MNDSFWRASAVALGLTMTAGSALACDKMKDKARDAAAAKPVVAQDATRAQAVKYAAAQTSAVVAKDEARKLADSKALMDLLDRDSQNGAQ